MPRATSYSLPERLNFLTRSILGALSIVDRVPEARIEDFAKELYNIALAAYMFYKTNPEQPIPAIVLSAAAEYHVYVANKADFNLRRIDKNDARISEFEATLCDVEEHTPLPQEYVWWKKYIRISTTEVQRREDMSDEDMMADVAPKVPQVALGSTRAAGSSRGMADVSKEASQKHDKQKHKGKRAGATTTTKTRSVKAKEQRKDPDVGKGKGKAKAVDRGHSPVVMGRSPAAGASHGVARKTRSMAVEVSLPSMKFNSRSTTSKAPSREADESTDESEGVKAPRKKPAPRPKKSHPAPAKVLPSGDDSEVEIMPVAHTNQTRKASGAKKRKHETEDDEAVQLAPKPAKRARKALGKKEPISRIEDNDLGRYNLCDDSIRKYAEELGWMDKPMFSLVRCEECIRVLGPKHRCIVQIDPTIRKQTSGCYRCKKVRRGCSIAPLEQVRGARKEQVKKDFDGHCVARVFHAIAQQRLDKRLYLPQTPEDAIRMLRGIHEKQSAPITREQVDDLDAEETERAVYDCTRPTSDGDGDDEEDDDEERPLLRVARPSARRRVGTPDDVESGKDFEERGHRVTPNVSGRSGETSNEDNDGDEFEDFGHDVAFADDEAHSQSGGESDADMVVDNPVAVVPPIRPSVDLNSTDNSKVLPSSHPSPLAKPDAVLPLPLATSFAAPSARIPQPLVVTEVLPSSSRTSIVHPAIAGAHTTPSAPSTNLSAVVGAPSPRLPFLISPLPRDADVEMAEEVAAGSDRFVAGPSGVARTGGEGFAMNAGGIGGGSDAVEQGARFGAPPSTLAPPLSPIGLGRENVIYVSDTPMLLDIITESIRRAFPHLVDFQPSTMLGTADTHQRVGSMQHGVTDTPTTKSFTPNDAGGTDLLEAANVASKIATVAEPPSQPTSSKVTETHVDLADIGHDMEPLNESAATPQGPPMSPAPSPAEESQAAPDPSTVQGLEASSPCLALVLYRKPHAVD